MKIPRDPHGFLRPDGNWCAHLPLLLLALEETKHSPHHLLELGLNTESTPLLHDYCRENGRRAVVVDDRILECAEWLRRIPDCLNHEIRCAAYDEAGFDRGEALWSVAVVSNSPGERRKRDVARLADRAEIIILRDSEPAANYGYHYDEIWPLFRHRADVKTGGAWASAVSNSVDLSKWRGARLGQWTVTLGDDDPTRSETSETIESLQKGRPNFEGSEGLDPLPTE